MAKKSDTTETTAAVTPEAGAEDAGSPETQAGQQTGQQVRVKIDDAGMHTNYANAFRTNVTAEEVIVDLGLNQVFMNRQAGQPADAAQPAGEIQFQITERLIMNYYTAKRLAITLSQIIRRYEDRFGDLKLNAADRVQSVTGTVEG